MQQRELRTLLLELNAAHANAERYCELLIQERERFEKRISVLDDEQARLRIAIADKASAIRKGQQVTDALSKDRDQLLVSYLETKNLLARHVNQEPSLRAELARSAQYIADIERKVAQRETEFVGAHRFWMRNQPKEVTLSTQDEVVGGGWHYAEGDGRWTGPDLISSLKLPALTPGRYLITLSIVDAMSSEICSRLRIEINGKTIEFRQSRVKPPFIISIECYVENCLHQPHWEVALRLPEVRSPAEDGSNDVRLLGIKVAWMKLRLVT